MEKIIYTAVADGCSGAREASPAVAPGSTNIFACGGMARGSYSTDRGQASARSAARLSMKLLAGTLVLAPGREERPEAKLAVPSATPECT